MQNFKSDIKNRHSSYAPAIFLDRNGVIIEDTQFNREPEEVKLCIGGKRLFDKCNELDLAIVIVTNQPGIAGGLSTWDDYNAVTDQMLGLLDYPKCLRGIYAIAI